MQLCSTAFQVAASMQVCEGTEPWSFPPHLLLRKQALSFLAGLVANGAVRIQCECRVQVGDGALRTQRSNTLEQRREARRSMQSLSCSSHNLCDTCRPTVPTAP